MAEKKIILCDVDGTLVDYDNNLPASFVTTDVDDDSLYDAFVHFGLIEG